MADKETFYNEQYEDVRQWNSLFDHEYFGKLTNKIEADIHRLQLDIDKLVSTPTLDNSINVCALGKAKESLTKLLSYFKFMRQQKVQLDNELVKRKTVNPASYYVK